MLVIVIVGASYTGHSWPAVVAQSRIGKCLQLYSAAKVGGCHIGHSGRFSRSRPPSTRGAARQSVANPRNVNEPSREQELLAASGVSIA